MTPETKARLTSACALAGDFLIAGLLAAFFCWLIGLYLGWFIFPTTP